MVQKFRSVFAFMVLCIGLKIFASLRLSPFALIPRRNAKGIRRKGAEKEGKSFGPKAQVRPARRGGIRRQRDDGVSRECAVAGHAPKQARKPDQVPSRQKREVAAPGSARELEHRNLRRLAPTAVGGYGSCSAH